ncbi:23S rRNA (uracil(1939)-C(5))-methyltransferase RlmD [Veronia nyctiphanis]|uniref:23S rRNA (uracil(1939)-C(5))-methyltransferase RlmD n=1 Tax=Veronia nyctiphanis TaxID=1278244 RepID=A0A4Q0YP65_9GAMM|nr:23S rRNA (uracil(1939)-C(5))-methyltransferase RlmD [Veronia nyctiphanis]RXJ72313.1 23S rRNA (uracil(1939)-C(5))-methyltransferase RlmD [Veronia nyctiphanis]
MLDTKHKALRIERLDHHGDGVAFIDKKPVFIAGSLPGETVVAQLTEDKRQFARAKLIKVTEPSASRVNPFCVHYDACGGCNLQHLGHTEQVASKQQTLSQLMNKFAGRAIEQVPASIDSDKGYRRRTRLSVRVDKDGKLMMGFRQRSSNAIVSVNDCAVLRPAINALLPKLHACLDGLKGRRIIGHIELVEADNGTVLSVRTTKPLHQIDLEQLDAFVGEHSLIFYLQQGDAPLKRILGDAPEYRIDGQALHFEPSDFIQVNPSINDKMVSQALAWLDLNPSDQVLDLFCGLGNFSLPIAQQAGSVVGVEGVDIMVERATDNAVRNQIENARFYHANLEEGAEQTEWGKQTYQKILLDPARAGASGIMPFVAKSGAEKIVYVSCNPSTLARDSQHLLDKGYILAQLGMVDMFPHTGHLESMALFVKA